MPREFGPTRFSLSQANNARAAMVEAARTSFVADAGAKTFPDLRLLKPEFPIEPIHNIYPLEVRLERNSATPLRLRLAAAGALGLAFLAACGGGNASKPKEATPTPTEQPKATATLAPEATATPIPEPTATEVILSPDEIKSRVLAAASSLLNSEDNTNLQFWLEDGFDQVNLAESDPNYINSAVNHFVSAAVLLAKRACDIPEDRSLPDAWRVTRDFVYNYAKEKHDAGLYPGDPDSGSLATRLSIPDSCVNQYFLSLK